jgi:hypothetical protein
MNREEPNIVLFVTRAMVTEFDDLDAILPKTECGDTFLCLENRYFHHDVHSHLDTSTSNNLTGLTRFVFLLFLIFCNSWERSESNFCYMQARIRDQACIIFLKELQ